MLRHARAAATAALAAAALAGCGKAPIAPAGEGSMAVSGGETAGAGAISTKNTTRIGGSSAEADAAAVARTVYPGIAAEGRPRAVLLVDARDWPAALAASVLEGRPLRAPLLYTEGPVLGGPSEQALAAMSPTGDAALGGAQAIRIGEAAAPPQLRIRSLSAAEPAALAVAVERLQAELRGRRPRRVIVTAWDASPAMTEPAAGLAALSSAPILFVKRSSLPDPTRAELARLGRRTSIYAIGPASVVSESVLDQLRAFGTVTRVGAGPGNGGSGGAEAGSRSSGGAEAGGGNPSANAVAVARFSDGSFGWGAQEAGHGFVFASAARPLDGPAAAALAAGGDFAPLVLLDAEGRIPASVSEYVGDLQPGYPPSGPVHGVYNHGWLIGDERAVPAATQAQLDSMLEISPRKTSTEPAAPELESPPPAATTTTAPAATTTTTPRPKR